MPPPSNEIVPAFNVESIEGHEVLTQVAAVLAGDPRDQRALHADLSVAKGTGKLLDVPFVHVWTVVDGKATRFRQFLDTAGWNEALSGARAMNDRFGEAQTLWGRART